MRPRAGRRSRNGQAGPAVLSRPALPEVMPDLRTWAPFDIAWTQRYAVSTYCRILYALHTAEVASKRRALESFGR